MTDPELVAHVLSGRREDYAELVRRHHAAVLTLCRSLLADDALADDAAQEAFLKAYRSLAGFQGGAAFGTWLYRIASNHCLDLRRRRARRPTESLDSLREDDPARVERLLREPDAAGAAAEAKDLVERVLSRIPEDYRAILTLREVQGLSYQELMEVLGCTLDSVKARLRRAREALERELRHFSERENV